jgi:Lipocalin-like domain
MPEDDSARDRRLLLGAWRLVAVEATDREGRMSQPFGGEPAGQLTYERSGRMSAQLVRGARERLAHADPHAATAEEALAAFRGYVGYFGTFSVDAPAGEIVHHVERSWMPNQDGSDQVRRYRLDGDRLELEGDTPWGVTRIRWRRVGAADSPRT